MCGIGGILAKGNQDLPNQALEKMSRALLHRGPDDCGASISADRKIGLVHRRLSIIDPTPGARQPMADASGKVTIVLNGEIYNYKELREPLLKSGYPFRTSSDTEVILSLYETQNVKLLTLLRGMFAFALWDYEKKTLLLARDRMGIKPLYYVDTGNFLVFASEVRAILATGLVAKQLSLEAFSGYLSFGSIPAPHTLIENIKSLEPATVLRIENGTAIERRYWNFHFDDKAAGPALLDSLYETLKDSVAAHLVSDVPVGIFLSGGIDSTVITALMRSITPEAIRSFSITFPDSPLDEARFARMAAVAFGTQHIEKTVTAQDFEKTLPHILAAMDQPTIDGVNTYFVSQLARESGVKVVLSGLGGDELFAGYPSFRIIPRLLRAYAFAGSIPFGKQAIQILLDFAPGTPQIESISEFFKSDGSLEAGYFAVRRLFLEKEKAKLISPDRRNVLTKKFAPTPYLRALSENGKTLDPIDATHLLEMRAYLHNQLLRDADTLAMAHGVEVRVPFLDHLLIEKVLQVDPKTRVGSSPKELLLSRLAEKIPPAIYKRPKMGFTFPLEAWLRGDARFLLDSFFQRPPRGRISEILHWPEVLKIWNGFLNRRVHWSRPWSIFVLNEWMEKNL